MSSVIKTCRQFLRRLVPENQLGDRFIAFMNFIRIHHRLPRDDLSFNDVLYAIKTSDEIISPLRVLVSDKEFVKLYVKAVAGDAFNVPTLKVLHTFDEVADYPFPANCCIKPTHLSGEVILRKAGAPVDLARIEKWLGSSLYPSTREANYRTLQPKIIVEPLVFGGDDLLDFKIFCYLGKPRMIVVDIDRYTRHSAKYFDTSWNELPFTISFTRSLRVIPRPRNLDEMLSVAGALSQPFSFIRIDLYSNGDQCLVGEITNCPWNVAGVFIPASAEKLASKILFETQ